MLRSTLFLSLSLPLSLAAGPCTHTRQAVANSMELPIELDLDGGFAVPLPGEEDPLRNLPSDEDSYFDFEVGEPGHERGDLSAKSSASGANEVPRDSTERRASELSQEETGAGDEQQSPAPPKYVSEVYSLTHIATQIIASNLADYPPGSFGLLGEHQWNGVVHARVKQKIESTTIKPKSSKHKPSLDNGTTKMKPVLSAQQLMQIESHPNNEHLAKSRLTDNLLWKEVVDYHFSGMNRPKSLEIPCDELMDKISSWGLDLLSMMNGPVSEDEWNAKHGIFPTKGAADVRDEDNALDADSSSDESEDIAERALRHTKGRQDKKLAAQSQPPKPTYHQHLENHSSRSTNRLRYMLKSLRETPMDVTLLSDTGIGKSLAKTLKRMKKMLKRVGSKDEHELEHNLLGYPRFWKEVNWGMARTGSDHCVKSCLAYLEFILQDWKDMAAQGNEHESSNKDGETSKSHPSCGQAKGISAKQHSLDMKLLHASPDWRSLYLSLKRRQEIVQKTQGDRVRATRQKLESDRRKIGKVVLTKAVGRVRGGDEETNPLKRPGQPTSQLSSRSQKREAILNKSQGHAAKRARLAANPMFSTSSKISKLKQETKVAASWSKSRADPKPSFGANVARANVGNVSRADMPSTFGAAIAGARGGVSSHSAGATRDVRGGSGRQVRVHLQNGRQMTMPCTTSPKSTGIFSSLEVKMKRKADKSAARRPNIDKRPRR